METNHCPNCHAPIPANAPGGFCPACLLRDAEEPPASGHSAPPIEEIAAAFPQLEVTSLIGQGGMGFVYKVRQPSLDRVVALKILSPELGRDPAFAERFAREARTLGKLHHPNIVTVFEHGEAGGFFYLIMEYVDGVNLRQAMRAGRFTPQQALAIVPGICDALQYAHEQGVWHRDIKPENILLDRDGKVKIADFGIARIVGNPQRDFTLTMTGNALGSAAYMAPEQHEKPHAVDHRADIYSLGVVIYEMLTGELPLGRFPSPSQRTAVDARIDEIVFKTLEKERDLRQQSATEVKTDMHRAMQPGQCPPVQSATIAAPRRPVGLAKLAFGLFLFGITIPFLLWIISERAAERGIMLSALMMLLSLVLGMFSFRETLGKVVAISSMLILLLGIAMMTRDPRERGIPHEISSEVKDNADQLTVPEAPAAPTVTKMEKATPHRPPVMRVPKAPAAPTVTVEEVFRKAVAAANESDGQQFELHMKMQKIESQDPIAMPKREAPLFDSSSFKQPLEMMELFIGEVVNIKVVSIEKKRLAAINSAWLGEFSPVAWLGEFSPVVYTTIRKSDGTLTRVCVKFENYDGRWAGSDLWFPNYRAFCRVEFKPDKGDAATMLKTHLGKNTDFRAVENKLGEFDVFGFGEDADDARTHADMCVENLRVSLKKFGLDTALKVISPAVIPEAPYMAEDEPPFVEPKP